MKKYIIILIIIIILYYVQKYCIQSEVDKILITKKIIDNFADVNINGIDDNNSINLLASIARDLQKDGLRIFGDIILKNKHKLISEDNWLRVRDATNINNNTSMSVGNLEVTNLVSVGTGLQNQLKISSINGTNSINSQAPILINSEAQQISLIGNTDICGNLVAGNTHIKGNLTVGIVPKKPILTKIVTNNSTNKINTNVKYIEYTGIAFSGYDYIEPSDDEIIFVGTETEGNTGSIMLATFNTPSKSMLFTAGYDISETSHYGFFQTASTSHQSGARRLQPALNTPPFPAAPPALS